MSVAIIMGSGSDRAVADKAVKTLKELGVDHTINVCSAHRTPEELKVLVAGSGAKVFIAIAGLSAALPGAIAALTTRPVIGVPVSGKVNMDSILSIVQMPPGIPVAAVGLDRGDNAALLAAQVLALSDEAIAGALKEHRGTMAAKVKKDDESVREALGGDAPKSAKEEHGVLPDEGGK